jgi:hypothetical protein
VAGPIYSREVASHIDDVCYWCTRHAHWWCTQRKHLRQHDVAMLTLLSCTCSSVAHQLAEHTVGMLAVLAGMITWAAGRFEAQRNRDVDCVVQGEGNSSITEAADARGAALGCARGTMTIVHELSWRTRLFSIVVKGMHSR